MSAFTIASPARPQARSRRLESAAPYALWAAQAALAATFIFAGAMKFIMPMEDMQKEIAWSPWFMYFIGAAELAGGFGLVLPGLLNIRRGLTPLAAGGLVIIMTGAAVTTAVALSVAGALFPLALGIIAVAIVRGRWSWFTTAR